MDYELKRDDSTVDVKYKVQLNWVVGEAVEDDVHRWFACEEEECR